MNITKSIRYRTTAPAAVTPANDSLVQAISDWLATRYDTRGALLEERARHEINGTPVPAYLTNSLSRVNAEITEATHA